MAVPSTPERNPWITILAGALVERGHMPPPEHGAPSPFSMASEEHTRALVKGAGFADVHVEEVPVHFTFRNLDDYMSYVTDTAGPFAIVLRGLSGSHREAIKVQLGEAFDPFATDGGYELPGAALSAVAS